MSRITFQISFDRPRGATEAECREYVESALATECGGRHIYEDPMSGFDRGSLRIQKVRPAVLRK